MNNSYIRGMSPIINGDSEGPVCGSRQIISIPTQRRVPGPGGGGVLRSISDRDVRMRRNC